MSISDGELNRLRAGEEDPAAEECLGERSFLWIAPRVFLAGESATVGERKLGDFVAVAVCVALLEGEA
jgi:hypothetical protein